MKGPRMSKKGGTTVSKKGPLEDRKREKPGGANQRDVR